VTAAVTITVGPARLALLPRSGTAEKVTGQVPAGSVVDALHIPLEGEPETRLMARVRPATDVVTLVVGNRPSYVTLKVNVVAVVPEPGPACAALTSFPAADTLVGAPKSAAMMASTSMQRFSISPMPPWCAPCVAAAA